MPRTISVWRCSYNVAPKGYETFVVQDIVLNAAAIRTDASAGSRPDGTMVLAALPAGVNGHFGPELRRVLC